MYEIDRKNLEEYELTLNQPFTRFERLTVEFFLILAIAALAALLAPLMVSFIGAGLGFLIGGMLGLHVLALCRFYSAQKKSNPIENRFFSIVALSMGIVILGIILGFLASVFVFPGLGLGCLAIGAVIGSTSAALITGFINLASSKPIFVQAKEATAQKILGGFLFSTGSVTILGAIVGSIIGNAFFPLASALLCASLGAAGGIALWVAITLSILITIRLVTIFKNSEQFVQSNCVQPLTEPGEHNPIASSNTVVDTTLLVAPQVKQERGVCCFFWKQKSNIPADRVLVLLP